MGRPALGPGPRVRTAEVEGKSTPKQRPFALHGRSRAKGLALPRRPPPGNWPTRTWPFSSRCRTRSSACSTCSRASCGATAPRPPSSATARRNWRGCRSSTSSIPTTWCRRSPCSTNPPLTRSRPGSSRATGARTAAGAGWSGRHGDRPSPASSTEPPATSPATTSPRAALGANEAWLAAILDHSNAAIFVKDRMERYVVVNEIFLRAFGHRARGRAGEDRERDLARRPCRRHRHARARPR